MKKTLLHLALAALFLGTRATTFADAAPATPPASGPREVKIALNEITVLAEQKGWLKEEFDKVGATAKLVPCSVAVVPALLNRGDVDLANSMHGFSFVQLLNGFDPVIVWQSADVDPRTVVITVLKDSPLKSLADLKGKTLGVPLWTCGYYGASEALRNAGVPLDTKEAPGAVHYVNVTDTGLSVTANLLTGKVDAIATHPSGLASLYNQGLIRDIGTAVPGGQFVHDRIVYYTTRQWAQDNPDLIKAFITVQNKTLVWIRDNRQEAAKIVAQAIRQPVDVEETAFQEPGNQRLFFPEQSYEGAVNAFEQFQKMAISYNDGLINDTRKPLTDQQVHDLFDKRFFKGGAYYPGDTVVEQNAAAPASGLAAK